MKIAVVEFAGKGGLIHYAYQLCRAMYEQGADVTLVTDVHYELESLPHPFTLDRALHLWDPKPATQRSGAPWSGARLRRASRALLYHREWLRLIPHLRKLHADVVQFGDIRFATDIAMLKAARATARVSADICHNVHPFTGAGTFGLSRFERALYGRIYDGFDAIFVHYATNVAEFAKTFPRSAPKVTPIVHGNEEIFRELASPDITSASLRRQLNIGDNDRVVLFFGTISRYKGLDLLVEAFDRVENATLVIAGFPLGDVPAETERVRIVPRYIDSDAVAAWMDLADVIVFPYRNVFQSGALHVAQTFGVPIVATRAGATAEVIRDRETGLLAEPGAFADAINELLTDRALAKALGEAAAREARSRFSWSGVASAILRTYEDVL